ncbi:MAG: Lrp/AsnC family transcriptional regulator [Thermotaleaceae bacterium]
MIDKLDKSIIQKLQEDLPLTEQPFKWIADTLEIKEEELLEKIKGLLDKGMMRRLGAVLYHRKAGYGANAMVVWVVPADKIDGIGNIMASFSCVSHCYQRPTFPDWPYNLFTMIHGRTFEECEEQISQVAKAVNLENYEILYSTKELKKTSMQYFQEE